MGLAVRGTARRLRRAKGHRLIHKPLKARKVQGIHGRAARKPRLQPLERPEGVVPYGDHLKASASWRRKSTTL